MALSRHALILSRGDPGLFDVLRRIGKGALGFATGGPVGAVRAVIPQAFGFGGRVSPSTSFRGPNIALPPVGSVPRPGGGSIPILRVPGVRGTLERAFPGGATGLQVAREVVSGVSAPGGGCASGFHPNKSAYMTRAGFIEKGTRCVRNRRRNLSNGRANTRALRRMAAWDKQERKLGKTMKAIARGR